MGTARSVGMPVEQSGGADVGVATGLREPSERHPWLVRVTHWVSALCFLALLVTGIEIVISHPRFYWGETGNVNMKPLINLHIPASRGTVPTGYGYVMPDQNGWSRALHFEAAWFVVLTGLLYVIWGVFSGHFARELVPDKGERSAGAIWRSVKGHLRLGKPSDAEESSYNVLQQLAYLGVIFVLFPLVIWTGLAMSPSWDAAFPATVNLLGGRQTARTLHFFVTVALTGFLLVHLAMIFLAGFWSRTKAMITGRIGGAKEGR